jgi:hypothetical protein
MYLIFDRKVSCYECRADFKARQDQTSQQILYAWQRAKPSENDKFVCGAKNSNACAGRLPATKGAASGIKAEDWEGIQ